MYGKTPTVSGRCHFYSYFQNPSESSGMGKVNAEYFMVKLNLNSSAGNRKYAAKPRDAKQWL